MVKGVLLDLDGTLIDSNEAHARSWMEALSEFGIPADYAEVRVKIGKGGDHLLPELTGINPESSLGKKIKEHRTEVFFEDYLPRLKPFPGARALLEVFTNHDIRFLAATSASKKECKALLRQAHLEDLIPHFVTGDDVDNSKPNPDIFCEALTRIRLPKEHAMVLGDTPYDLESAERAGIRSVAFTCGGWPKDKLTKATAIYQGPWELLAAFDRSPFADSSEAA